MRLSKFLSLAVAMSRNQAKFFIGKGRLSVDGEVVTDPFFEVSDDSRVTFDGKPITASEFQYIVMHKPASYSCSAKDTERSVLDLLTNRAAERYYYFANVLAPEATGLVLFSDDARWTNRIKKRLLKKPRLYQISANNDLSEECVRQLNEAWLGTPESQDGDALELSRDDGGTLQLTTGNVGAQRIVAFFAAMDKPIATPHLQQLGRLNIGDLAEGDYLELTETEVKI
ncbi:MAG: S4 domain-containing protein [Pseudomonadota bacterium]